MNMTAVSRFRDIALLVALISLQEISFIRIGIFPVSASAGSGKKVESKENPKPEDKIDFESDNVKPNDKNKCSVWDSKCRIYNNIKNSESDDEKDVHVENDKKRGDGEDDIPEIRSKLQPEGWETEGERDEDESRNEGKMGRMGTEMGRKTKDMKREKHKNDEEDSNRDKDENERDSDSGKSDSAESEDNHNDNDEQERKHRPTTDAAHG